nr:flavin reductase [Nocardioides immobilis]
MTPKGGTITPEAFRRVLGQFPTGVAVVTSVGRDGKPVGMVVGSFTSVSLDPPLVGFLPAVTSTTWPKIEAAGRFCVNILGAEQERLCRDFSRSGSDKFAGVSWFPSPGGAPVLTDSLAWIDCEIDRVDPAGDHVIVLGAVTGMQAQSQSSPLVFFRGGYGGFRPGALVAGDPQGDLVMPLRIVDLARQDIDALSERWSTQCAVTAMVGDEVVVLAVAGAAEGAASNAFIGGRNRAVPPIGASFMAWQPDERVAAWLRSAPPDQDGESLLARLKAMKNRGYAVSLEGGAVRDWQQVMAGATAGDPAHRHLPENLTQSFGAQFEAADADRVRNVHVPVLGPDGRVGVVLNVGGFTPLDAASLSDLIADVRTVADNISRRVAVQS